MSGIAENDTRILNAEQAAQELGVGIDLMLDYLERGMVEGAFKPYKGSPWHVPSPVQVRRPPRIKTAEAARILRRTRAGVRYFREAGKLPSARKEMLGTQEYWLYDRDEVEELAQRINADQGRESFGPETEGAA